MEGLGRRRRERGGEREKLTEAREVGGDVPASSVLGAEKM